MGFVIGLIIGLAAGAAIAYFLSSKKSSAQAATIQDLKRQLDLAESEHERRLREATTRLQRDYQAQLKAVQAQAAPTTRPEPTPPNALASPPPTASQPTEPLPKPATAPPEPKASASPVTATAPTPVPQSVSQSPDVPTPSVQRVPGTEPPTDITDPNALLAASYSPKADDRGQVAAAIASILPTAGPKEQARWFPVLGRLARDTEAEVRLRAIQALGGVKSPKRMPLLRRALRDTDPAVVEAASAMLSQSKGRSLPKPPSQKRRLPKNK
jgi:hypothetical protein